MGDKNIRTFLLLSNINTLNRHFHLSYFAEASENTETKASSYCWSVNKRKENFILHYYYYVKLIYNSRPETRYINDRFRQKKACATSYTEPGIHKEPAALCVSQ